MKTIVVRWVKEEEWGYGKAMRVIESDHEKFKKGTRFYFGFFSIATDEGYTIISLPEEILRDKKNRLKEEENPRTSKNKEDQEDDVLIGSAILDE